ncbi:MAG TPA: 3-isopropylmalate dehydrogenase [Microthrixaceae bacterium]|nr:3-isopropylmalate dehydrogenase [Microthrixaceae bacterium]RTL08457.1 MAG: 3-isopropylmalate dehydrogenase [Acidimicrobiia bacterium]MCB9375305.1 3-isopropylmalate dehydrogenase [Microthrixaceae bacterium]MCB9401336.1 3-isopropylmalate dehydrogenase [Microthrixaceae bacterium]MCO5306774.1 3-isopropylmalate dehydrogenase [Microthrixaceae bacterium]
MTHRIGVIGGDGIGPEVLAEALKVLDATGVAYDRTDYDLGAHRYLADGTVLPDEVLEEWRGLDALLLGAVGDPAPGVAAPAGLVERGILLRMRFDLDQYINLRPFRLPPKADFEVIRENTEGTYAGEGGFLRKGTPNEIATQGSVNTRLGVERCVRFAFERAAATDRRHLTLVHKKNVLTFAGDLWQRTFDEVAEQYPQVSTGYDHIDAACIHFVERPERYDVIVTDNLFGDILTDLGGAVAGGVGYAASANLNPARTGPSMFEPVHGTAPDIAGQNKANPIAAIISLQLMLDFLGEADAAAAVAAACDNPERYTGSTTDIGDAVAAAVRSA